MPHPGPLQTGLLVGGVMAVVGGLVWLLETQEREQHRLGVSPEEWDRGRKQVRANMDGRPEWLRRCHRWWNRQGQKGEELLNRSE